MTVGTLTEVDIVAAAPDWLTGLDGRVAHGSDIEPDTPQRRARRRRAGSEANRPRIGAPPGNGEPS